MMQDLLQKAGKATNEHAKNLAMNIEPRVEQAKKHVGSLRERGKKAVQERPLLALAIAFVVGLSIGLAIGKSGDRN
jgi:ElaB/YqjD/DUF883 family membrane-anchored ribosome-binding protein